MYKIDDGMELVYRHELEGLSRIRDAARGLILDYDRIKLKSPMLDELRNALDYYDGKQDVKTECKHEFTMLSSPPTCAKCGMMENKRRLPDYPVIVVHLEDPSGSGLAACCGLPLVKLRQGEGYHYWQCTGCANTMHSQRDREDEAWFMETEIDRLRADLNSESMERADAEREIGRLLKIEKAALAVVKAWDYEEGYDIDKWPAIEAALRAALGAKRK